MMYYSRVYALFLLAVLLISCGQNQKRVDGIKSEIKDTVTAYGPTTMVRNVKKGRNGTILIAASWGGVFRYDPKRAFEKRFTNLTTKIGSHRFWDVLEDRQGNLWFASTDAGVYRFNGKSFQHFTTDEGLANNAVMAVYEDKAGILWFATGGGVSRYDPSQPEGKSFRNFTTKEGLPSNHITTILEDRTGKIWIGTRGETCVYDGKTFTVPRTKEGKAFTNVWGITEDKQGHIWFGATIIKAKKGDTLVVTTGLWHYDGSTFTKINQRGASAIIEDRKGNLWTTGDVQPNGVGAWKLLRYDQKSLSSQNPTVTEIMSLGKMLCGILEAEDGSIWFGSIHGVYRYDGKTITDFKDKAPQDSLKKLHQ
ncbi:two-component regulator propeller domain-containing protein [Siphonobacter sp. BAB-5385]|uniref:ligand-binding sensor domain-containing protein n=1 Tax=Siphonobacter sp. BAB-5385 TaxID=1864822 RepID=UPI0020CD3E47|nr:two-component regulator propeller domain-containing protein [Siphonobacter sp. BAB-5385]